MVVAQQLARNLLCLIAAGGVLLVLSLSAVAEESEWSMEPGKEHPPIPGEKRIIKWCKEGGKEVMFGNTESQPPGYYACGKVDSGEKSAVPVLRDGETVTGAMESGEKGDLRRDVDSLSYGGEYGGGGLSGEKTGLRVWGKPQGVFRRTVSDKVVRVMIETISVWVRNVGSADAVGVSVTADIPGYGPVRLDGTDLIPRETTELYTWKGKVDVSLKGKLRAKATCANCW